MTFVAEGLGVTLAREHIKKLPHPGVAFRPLVPPVKADYYIAWNGDNDSRALHRYIEIVRSLTDIPTEQLASNPSWFMVLNRQQMPDRLRRRGRGRGERIIGKERDLMLRAL